MEIFFLVRVRTRYKLSLVFRLSPVCSKFKFMFSVGIQLFGLKTPSHGKSDLKKKFWVRVRARYRPSLVFRLSPVCSMFKFMLSSGIQLFGLKTTSHGKSDLKI